MEKKLEALENLLPGLQEYFSNILVGEKLSDSAEKQRQFFLSEFDKMNEYRNPRRDSLPPLPPPPVPPVDTKPGSVMKNGVLYDNALQYDYAEDPNQNKISKVIKTDDFYEEPVPLEKIKDKKTKSPVTMTTTVDSIYEDTDLAVEKGEGEPTPSPLLSSASSPLSLQRSLSLHDDDDNVFAQFEYQDVDVPGQTASIQQAEFTPRLSTAYDSDASGSYEEYESDDDSSPSRQSSGKSTESDSNKQEKKKTVSELFSAQINDISVIHYGVLHQKRLMGTQWTKRFCMIRNMRFIAYTFKLSKDEMKIVIDISLVGFEVTYSQKEGKRSHVIKISQSGGSGGDKFLFAVAKKSEAQKWIDILTECAKATCSTPTTPQSATAPPTIDISGDSGSPIPSEADKTRLIIDRSDSVKSEDSTKSFDNIPSPTKGDMSPKIGKKNLADSLAQTASSLLAFARRDKKGKKKTPTSPVLDIPRKIETNTVMTGYLNICSSKQSDGKWNKCWCIVQDSAFKCYKVNSDYCQVQVPLQGCELQPVQDNKNKVMANMFQLLQGKETQVFAECTTLEEMARWIRVLIKEIGALEDEFAYVVPDTSGEIKGKVIKSADGEVVTQKDIVAKTLKLFEKTDLKRSKSKPKMQEAPTSARGKIIQKLTGQLTDSSHTGHPAAGKGDKNRIESSDNTFLEKVRIQRRLSHVHKLHTQKERLQDEKSHLNRMLSDLRAHKSELKEKKLMCRDDAERRKIDNNTKDIDIEIQQIEEEAQQVTTQLDNLSEQLEDAEEGVAISRENLHGDDDNDDLFYDCQDSSQDSTKQNNGSDRSSSSSSKPGRKAVLARAKMWESMSAQ